MSAALMLGLITPREYMDVVLDRYGAKHFVARLLEDHEPEIVAYLAAGRLGV